MTMKPKPTQQQIIEFKNKMKNKGDLKFLSLSEVGPWLFDLASDGILMIHYNSIGLPIEIEEFDHLVFAVETAIKSLEDKDREETILGEAEEWNIECPNECDSEHIMIDYHNVCFTIPNDEFEQLYIAIKETTKILEFIFNECQPSISGGKNA